MSIESLKDMKEAVYYNNGIYDGQREASLRLQYLDRAMQLCDGTGSVGERRAEMALKIACMIEEFVTRKP